MNFPQFLCQPSRVLLLNRLITKPTLSHRVRFLNSMALFLLLSGEMAVYGQGSTLSDTSIQFVDHTSTLMPAPKLIAQSKDAQFADFDGDGDLDVAIAHEYKPNILLINDGTGKFSDESVRRLPQLDRDSEDVLAEDFDADGDIDLLFVSEDDEINELYFNNSKGYFYSIPFEAKGVTNSVTGNDLNGDGIFDIVLGNTGQNFILIGDGRGGFTNETSDRLPAINDQTQDIEIGDIDSDGDLDIIVGNEDSNRLHINDGRGVFTDQSKARLPYRTGGEETREADLGDIDGDGDLDIIFANVAFRPGGNPKNRILQNDGMGSFEDITTTALSTNNDFTMDADFSDLDSDGDLDIITTGLKLKQGLAPIPLRIFENDGVGKFSLATSKFLQSEISLVGTDIESHDFDGNGKIDIFITNRSGPDYLLLNGVD